MRSRTFSSGEAYGEWLRGEDVTVHSIVALGDKLVVTFEYNYRD